ncbi:hypothetical protein L873DRAFT_1823446 [Choiromyces venosus 120613-1]|uniref:Uncharacterized protein n=1 Tax=Choiromyces venosus 120613-1 TaxID=1336337 RepID=A0A3N4IVZ3_9PEZI|nr:hypothetical protein L873DRAFT_1823446 [Choiromyces venosus 120613-1]
MYSQASSTSSRKGKGKKKPRAPADPATLPQGTRWTTVAGKSSLSPIFTRPEGPPSLK